MSDNRMPYNFQRFCADMERANTILVGPPGSGMTYTSISEGIAAAVAGFDVRVLPPAPDAPYTGNVTVPTGINLIGSGNCVLDGNVILQGTASIEGIVLTAGHYIQQNGVKYYV